MLIQKAREDFLLNRLNYDPVLFWGCSQKEVGVVVAVIMLPLVLVGAIIGYAVWKNIPFGVLPFLVLGLILGFIALKTIARIKKNKEPGYLNQAITDAFEKSNFKKTEIIRRSGFWSVGRRA